MTRSAEFTIAEHDVIVATRIAARRRLLQPAYLVFIALLYVTAVAILSVLRGDASLIPLIIAAVIAPLLAWPIISRFIVPAQARRHFRQSSALKGVTKVEWDEEGIALASSHGNSRLAWSEFHDISESDGMVMLYQSEQLYNAVPLRALTEEQAADLRNVIAAAPEARGT